MFKVMWSGNDIICVSEGQQSQQAHIPVSIGVYEDMSPLLMFVSESFLLESPVIRAHAVEEARFLFSQRYELPPLEDYSKDMPYTHFPLPFDNVSYEPQTTLQCLCGILLDMYDKTRERLLRRVLKLFLSS